MAVFSFGELINSYVFFNEEKTREVSNKDVLIRAEVSRSYWRVGGLKVIKLDMLREGGMENLALT